VFGFGRGHETFRQELGEFLSERLIED